MKKWSKHWKASKLPKKQRKYLYNLPLHLKNKQLSAHLSDELSKKYGTRNMRVRKGDKVKIARGQNKGKTGTIEQVDTKNMKVYISGIEFTKRDGSKAKQPIHTSKIIIQELETKDKRRFTKQRSTKTEQKIPTETKPPTQHEITTAQTKSKPTKTSGENK